MPQKLKASAKSDKKTLTPSKSFRRALHSRAGIRKGLSYAREGVSLEQIPEIVEELGTSGIYLNVLAINPFPAELSDFIGAKRLAYAGRAKEFVWTASVLSLFSDRLSRFSELKEIFDTSVISGNYKYCREILDTVKFELGVSMWLIKNKILLLQLSDGLSAQKEYLDEILSTAGLNPIASVLSYYVSNRCEANVEKNQFDQETDQIVNSGDDISSYFLYQVRPYNSHWIEDFSRPMYWEEAQPVVDRLETFISMSRLYISREGCAASSFVHLALKQLNHLDHPEIDSLLQLFELSAGNTLEAVAPRYFDIYARGEYQTVLLDENAPLELRGRSAFMLHARLIGVSLAAEIVNGIADVVSCSPNYATARHRLIKLGMIFAGKKVGHELSEFLDAEPLSIKQDPDDIVLRVASTFDAAINPRHVSLISRITNRPDLLDLYSILYRDSESLILERTLADASVVMSASIPEYRASKYVAHQAYLSEDYRAAEAAYGDAISKSPPQAVFEINAFRCLALLGDGRVHDSIVLLAAVCLSQPEAMHRLPIEEVLEEVDPYNESSIELAIILFLAARDIDPSWQRWLSDVFENVLDELDVKRPSALRERRDLDVTPALVFFLRHICVPRVLDDTTIFDGVSEIEDERLLICQWLSELDPDHEDDYAQEIKSIVRTARIAQLLSEIDAGKIYVDEEGVRDTIDRSLRTIFSRFQESPKTQTSAYRSEIITRHMSELLGDKSNIDLSGLRLPTSESEGMLLSMLTEYVSAFALNPAFGLDTHVSTSIRHGAFEGHILSPLLVHHLFSEHNSISNDYDLDDVWEQRLGHLDQMELDYIRTCFARFTRKVRQSIDGYLENTLRIRDEEQYKLGAFDFLLNDQRRDAYLNRATSVRGYDELLAIMSDYCWDCVDEAVNEIQRNIVRIFQEGIGAQLSQLLSQIEEKIPHSQVLQIADAVALARTDLHVAVDGVVAWFRRPAELQREPYEFELALGVALRQIENCYVRTPLSPTFRNDPGIKFEGETFDAVVEVLFLLLQNIVRHSGISGPRTDVLIELLSRDEEGSFVFRTENKIGEGIDLDVRREQASAAAHRYEADTAMRMARKDAGSGLSKIWRIMEFSLRRTHNLTMTVSDDRVFVTEVSFSRGNVHD